MRDREIYINIKYIERERGETETETERQTEREREIETQKMIERQNEIIYICLYLIACVG